MVDLKEHLKNTFRLSEFRVGQEEIIRSIMNKKDTLAVLPTGGGKSLCYQLPTVSLGKLGIVVSPLIALMKDQVLALKKKGIPSGCLYSSQPENEKRQIFSDIGKGGPFLLYLSPERIQKEGFQKWILDKNLALFAIDEAHCVSQWGHDFREEYAELKILKTLRPDVPILALTASATPTVLDDVAKNLQLVDPSRMVHGFYRPNLYYQVETCADEGEKLDWLLQAVQKFSTGRVLIYCGTRKSTEEVATFLEKKMNNVGFYHAGLGNTERTAIQQSYVGGDLRVLVATNAFGMGIDQPDVRLVVHFQMPANIDSLYQEMGRAGRDGIDSTCLMLYSKKDKGLQSYFITNSVAIKAIKDLRWRNLEALVSYSESAECRHAEILTYYKDAQRLKKCGHCDVCDPNSSRKVLAKAPSNFVKATLTKKKSASKSSGAGANFGTSDAVPLTGEQEDRFNDLRRWRKEKAQELDLPAFVILADKSLRDLARKNPQTTDELKTIYGMGEAKIEKFGWDILAELKK